MPRRLRHAGDAPSDRFAAVSRHGLRGWVARDLPEDFFAAFTRDPNGFLSHPEVQVIKDGTKTTVVRARIGGGAARAVVVKRFRYTAPLRRLAFLFSESPAVKALRGALLLKQHGFDTAEPLAAFHSRSWAMLGTSYYIAEELEGTPLRSFWGDRSKSRERLRMRRLIIAGLADTFSRLHRAGIYHRDLKGSNILLREWLSGRPRFFLIDLELSAPRRPLPWKRRLKNLLQIRLAWSARERAHFYLSYAKLCAGSKPEAKTLARRVLALHREQRERAAAARDAATRRAARL